MAGMESHQCGIDFYELVHITLLFLDFGDLVHVEHHPFSLLHSINLYSPLHLLNRSLSMNVP